MITKAEFHEMVSNAFQTLYDFVALRSHPLTQLLIANDMSDPKERGWQMHHALLEVIEELYPGPDAPPFSKEWRRHRLMVLRYVEAMEPQTVADQLSISRRQFYREHASALDALVDILWERVDTDQPDDSSPDYNADQSSAMQAELARISLTDSYADLAEVLEGTLAVLDRVFQQHTISIERTLPDDLPLTSIGHNVLRQVLMGIFGYFIEHISHTTLKLTIVPGDDSVGLQIGSEPAYIFDEEDILPHLANYRNMLRLGSNGLDLLYNARQRPVGFVLELPLEYDCTVLAVDDNEDTLALYKRCLIPNRYRVITTPSAHAVLKLAHEVRPDIIILDLMMPDQDGWDLLQLLANQPDTTHIPIMICSVLKQRQLALTLGAAAFLEKPFTEQSLLKALKPLNKHQQ